MWNYVSTAGANSVTNRYRSMSKRDRLIMLVTRSIKKIGHTQWIDDPIADFFREYNEHTGYDYTRIDELDDVNLECLHQMFAVSIHELCEKIKSQSKKILETQQ